MMTAWAGGERGVDSGVEMDEVEVEVKMENMG